MKRKPSSLNCLIAIDKPRGLTSHDVVGHVRRAVNERRVGHAGTLDPAATGVMILGIGQATRLLGYLTLETKTYVAEIEFGTETATDDAEGEVTRTAEVPGKLFDQEYAATQVAGLVGSFDQVPPAYSAISVDGKRAYARARAGEDVRLEARPVRIEAAQLVSVVPADADGAGSAHGVRWVCVLRVSKGTYVRSIARDLGRALGTAAHLSALRRTSSGCVGQKDCIELADLETSPELARTRMLDPARCLGYPVRELSEREYADASCGKRLDARGAEGLVTLVHDGGVCGVWEAEGDALRCRANFPVSIKGVGRNA